ncbi:MAG: FlgD immunoglobulin-like domain containing protein [Alkalispirochaeta sp.]
MKFFRKLTLCVILLHVPAIVLFAGGAQEAEAPTLELPAQPRQYVSPENQDGVQDVLELPFSSVVVPAEEMVIVAYELTVYDGDGRLVYQISEREEERRGFFGNIFGGEKPRVAIPDTLTWDGTWQVPETRLPEGMSNGDLVEDGEYTYQLAVIDDAGKFSRSAPFNVTVDNTPPEIGEFRDPNYTIFSPNDDSIRDELIVPLAGSREMVWVVEVRDTEGNVVYGEEYRNENVRRPGQDPTPPEQFIWDGSTGTADDPGDTAPEGEYRVALIGRDRAGNEAEGVHPATFVLSLQGADLAVTVADPPAVFSPNDDGRRDTLTLRLDTSEPESVRQWRLEIVNRNQVVRSESGSGTPPAEWEFDGARDDGSTLQDGSVSARLWARLDNGNEVQSAPLTITIDTKAPEATLSADTAPQATEQGEPLVFGAGDKESIQGTIRYEAAADWSFELQQDGAIVTDGNVAEFFDVIGARPEAVADGTEERVRLVWRGEAIGESGMAPDGTYALTLTGEDPAGNVGRSRTLRVIKDSRTPGINLSVQEEYISPLSGGPYNSAVFRTEYGAQELIREFLFEIRNEDDRMVRSSYQRRPFNSFEWNGLTNGGTVVPDGPYTAGLRVIYRNGHEAEVSRIGPVIVDRTSPRIEQLSAEPRQFSPDDDGEDDEVRITQEVAPGDMWTGELLNAAGDTLLSREWGDSVESFTWDGRGPDGEMLPDGDYRYVLSSTDNAGNSTREQLLITIDTVPASPPVVRVSLRPRPFSPYGDRGDTLTMAINVESETNLTEWEVEIRSPDGNVFKTFSGSGAPPRSVTWDGMSDDGTLVEPGRQYPVSVTVRDDAGHEVVEEDSIETRPAGPPVVRVSLRPRPFSPYGDRGDTLTMAINVESETNLTEWEVEIRSPDGNVFKTFSGSGAPPRSVTWDGMSDDGTLVEPGRQYPVSVTVRDDAGHEVVEEDSIETRPAGPPEVRVSLRPQPFSPDGDGRQDTLTISINVSAVAELTGWEAVILSPEGDVFKTFSGSGTPPRRITWNGRGDDGSLVETARQYPLSVTVRDDVGHEVTEQDTIEIDILVMRDGNRLRIRVSNILFAGNTPDMFLSDDDQLDTNLETLRRLATILNRYPDREIIIEGHAAHIYLEGPAQQREQDHVLIPLSRARATEVMQALMILGVDRDRMTIEAYGGARPVVPHSNRDEMWRNRRVEFLLQRLGN